MQPRLQKGACSRLCGLAAQRAVLGFRRFGIGRPTWEAQGRRASRRAPPTWRASARAIRRGFEHGDHRRMRRRGASRRAARTPARRSSARASNAARSARELEQRGARPRADDLDEAEAVDRGPLERLRQIGVDRARGGLARRLAPRSVGKSIADRAADVEPADGLAPLPRRRLPPALRVQPAVDIDQGHRRRWLRCAARRPRIGRCRFALRRSDRPSPRAECIRRGKATVARERRARRRAARRSRRAQRALPRLGSGERLARDFDAERARLRSRPRRPRGSRYSSPPASAIALRPLHRATSLRVEDAAGARPRRRSWIRASMISPPSIRAARVSPIPRSISHSGKRVSRRFQQHARLGQRQADDVGIAAGDVADIDFAIALQRIAAGLAAPFAVAGVIVDLLVATAASSRSSSRPAARGSPCREWPARRRSARDGAGPTAASCTRAASLRPRPWAGCAGRPRPPCRPPAPARPDRAPRPPRPSRAPAAAHARAAARPCGTLSSMSAGIDRVGRDADAREQVEAARARRGEDQPSVYG